MKKAMVEVKAYAEAMTESNWKRDTYVNKEQDKFFAWLNRQHNDITRLEEHLEWLELRSQCQVLFGLLEV